MMSKNMEIWDKLKRPPESALKRIQAGRLKGKSDINPQWRYEVMTEVFGICGLGWKYEIKKIWQEQGSYDQITQFAEINLFINYDGWSAPIPAVGGSMLIAKESAGLHTNDEAVKMAVTDALGTAMKMLGVAADIYKGLWDGSKYVDTMNGSEPPRKSTTSNPTEPETAKKLLSVDGLIEKMSSSSNAFELKARWKKYDADIKSLENQEKVRVQMAKDKKKSDIELKEAAI